MRRVEIYDTTLRDGSQGEGVNFSLHDKLMIAQRLDRLGFDYIEGGYPLSNEKDAEFFQRIAEMPLAHAKVCAFGMTRRRGIRASEDPGMKALLASHAPVITIVGKTSEFHVREVLGVSLEENIAMIGDTIRYLREAGRQVIYDAEHFFDGWKLNPDYAFQTVRAAVEAGASIVVMCDTNGGTMPEYIAERARDMVARLGAPVGIHCHNDCDLATANSLAAVDGGAVQVQGTINGFGERCGNADLIAVIANLALKKGYRALAASRNDHGATAAGVADSARTAGVEHLTELSRFVYETANIHHRIGQPFVGQSAFAHKGGMHVHAIAKATSSYEHIPPEAVGNERRILVSELSGRSNIIAMTTKYEVQHDRSLMDRILEQVVLLENQGYQFEAAQGSFDLLVQRAAGRFTPHFERIAYHVNVETDRQGEITTEATVKLRVEELLRHEVAEGDGPVNALDAALRKALTDIYPTLASLQLVDYKVRVINSNAGTAAGVRVVIECRDEHDTWGTVGVSTNIIEASWSALVDSFEYKLHKDENAHRKAAEAGLPTHAPAVSAHA